MHKHVRALTEYNDFYMMPRTLSDVEITKFQNEVWNYYRAHSRVMPWRQNYAPYYVMVAELMLQQTQVSRVIPKFEQFIAVYPDVAALAAASLGDVLKSWSGLGYNRRAKFLWEAARQIERDHEGMIPGDYQALVSLPGIGPNTAGAILAYAYDEPAVFIETNIRTVLLHHFFDDTDDKVPDTILRDLASQTIDTEHPREWYWALMDYGTHLKKTAGGRLGQSASYRKQSPLEGSIRQMRGRIIRVLAQKTADEMALRGAVEADDRFVPALQALIDEGMVARQGDVYSLTVTPNTR
jgi:A/G-specific adenine glycosylase